MSCSFLGSGLNRGQSPVEWGDFPSVCPFVRPPLWASQPGLRPSQPGLRPSQPGLRPSQPGLRPSQPGLRPSQPGLRPSQPASQASGFTHGWLDLPFYFWGVFKPNSEDIELRHCPCPPHATDVTKWPCPSKQVRDKQFGRKRTRKRTRWK